jgi:hypothetical protein
MEHLILKLSCYGHPMLENGYMQAVIVKMAVCNRYLVSAVLLANACRRRRLFPNSLRCLEETAALAIIGEHLGTHSDKQ